MPDTWIRTSQRLPEKNQKVEWISPGGIQERGTFAGGLIWFPEGSSMYVYYTPEFWRPA
ncbi:MAG TPA: hypothetical protein VFV87_14305 [Pirellulaceae bacterium]|nr:hypothetical protein [Pirellulaceae bacterium]